MSGHWYIRVRAEVSGPFDRSQIDSLVRRQKLGRLDEISLDKVTWKRASEFPELFVASVAKKVRKGPPEIDQDVGDTIPYLSQPEIPARRESRAPAAKSINDWYVVANGVQLGPIGLRELQLMVANQRVLGTDLVWAEGMTDWLPTREIPELAKYLQPPSYPDHAQPVAGKTVAGTAIASLVLGILGLTLLFGLGSILAIVFGHWALSQIKRDPDHFSGNSLAIAGLILGYLALGAILILALYLMTATQSF